MRIGTLVALVAPVVAILICSVALLESLEKRSEQVSEGRHA